MKRFITTLLAICMVFTLCVPAMAAGMNNFKPVNTYSNNFVDVAASNWAMPSIKACYEYALMYGSSNTKFNPSGELTIAEALVMADRVHSIYNTGETAVFSGTPWYAPYEAYAITNGIIAETDFADITKKATRAQMAYIFFNSIPEWEFTEINSISRIPDVSVSHTYFHEIKGLYNAGILTGSDSKGSFYPDNNITRAEAAAIISRVVDITLRKTFTLEEEVVPEDTVLTAQQISEKCAPSVAYVEVYDKNQNPIASGSGFFIDADGTFVTNYHVIDGAYSAKIMTTEGKTYDVAGVYDFDVARDTALLKITGHDFEYLEIDTSTPVAGQRVYAIGSPIGLDNTISDGLVSNPNRELNGLDFIQISVPISSGSSGGALINEYGRVIGITSAGFGSDGTDLVQNLNLAIPIHYINELDRTSVKSLTRLASLVGESYELSLSESSLTVPIGYIRTVSVYFSPQAEDYLYLESSNENIALTKWGNDIATGECELTILGMSKGTAQVKVYYYDGNNILNSAVIDVTVGSTTSVDYYWNGAPTYHSITGADCFNSRTFDSSYSTYTDQEGYVATADQFTYVSVTDCGFQYYINTLKSYGWVYDSVMNEDTYTGYIYTKGSYITVISYHPDSFAVQILLMKEESNSSSSSARYYLNGAPTYQYVTGIPCISSYYGDTGRTVYYYAPDANLFAYNLTSVNTPISYMEYLESSGWYYYDGEVEGNVYTYYYAKGYELMSVIVDLDYYEVWIIIS